MSIESMYDNNENKALSQIVVMPRRLTAENGAKALLMGEFFEEFEVFEIDEFGDEVSRFEKVPVSWDTIKSIYEKIVSHYGA